MEIKKHKSIAAMTLAVVLLFTLLCTFTGCRSNKGTEDTQNTEETEGYQEPVERGTLPSDQPALVVEGVKANAGDQRVEVLIDVVNNPGILGMDYDLYYDEAVMTLVDAQSQLAPEDYEFTAPAYYKNPTTFLWDAQDAKWFEDGTVLKLYFDISADAPAGKYEIKIMYSYGNIVDADGEPIELGVKNGYISIS